MCLENEHIYDGFEHLHRALFWECDQPIVMLTFYADDSGKEHQHEYIVVAGYIGLVAQWDRFTPDWRVRLAQAGFPKSGFHARKFFPGSGEFAEWAKPENTGARNILLNDLAKMINRYALHSFACAVHVPAWQTVNAEYCLAERLLRPYPLCGRTIVKQVRDWCQATGHDPGAVRYVFDQDFDDWGMLIDRLKLDYAIAPIPADRRDVRPLQAADWLAYEGFRET